MNNFEPDYTNILQAANNLKPNRMPLYEHIISEKVMEEILNKEFAELINGNLNDKREYIRNSLFSISSITFSEIICS